MKTLTTILLTLLIATTSYAQTNIKSHFNSLKKGEEVRLNTAAITTLSKDKNSIANLKKHVNSDDKKIAKEAISLTTKIGSTSPYPEMRKEAVNVLLGKALTAPSATISQIAKSTKKFKIEDFDSKSKTQLKRIITEKKPHLRKYLMLAGFLGMSEELEALKLEYKKGSPEKQALNLARVRAGNTERLASLMRNIPKIPINDEFVYDIAPMLIYVHQKEAMDYLLDIIENGKKTCTPADAETPGSIECGYRLMEMIAPAIEDFPFEVDETTGEIITDDYAQALKDVKQWIRTNKNKYQLITDNY